MSIQMTIIENDDYLEVKLSGKYRLDDLFACGEQAGKEAQLKNKKGLLIDMTKIVGNIPDLEKVELGKKSKDHFGSLKVAFIDRREQDMKFSENVSINRGANVRSFTDHSHAVKWLLEK